LLRLAIVVALGLVFVVACWKDVFWPPDDRHCWGLEFQNGSHSRVCCDSITTTPDPVLAGYFTVTAWKDDQRMGAFSWVWKARPIDRAAR
jgi:hypothetical protein